MSLIDRTNEDIQLSLHRPLVAELSPDGDTETIQPRITVDVDQDSSFEPANWVHILWVDDDHDLERIKLTYKEAGLLHDRLGLILGRSGAKVAGS